MTLQEVFDAIDQLSPEDRESLRVYLDVPEPDFDEAAAIAYDAELKRRIESVKNGTAELIEWTDVEAELDRAIAERRETRQREARQQEARQCSG